MYEVKGAGKNAIRSVDVTTGGGSTPPVPATIRPLG
jgi:hypothetical protein